MYQWFIGEKSMYGIKSIPALFLMGMLLFQTGIGGPGGVTEGEYLGITLSVDNGALHSFDENGARIWCMAPDVILSIDASGLETPYELTVVFDNVSERAFLLPLSASNYGKHKNEIIVSRIIQPMEQSELVINTLIDSPDSFKFIAFGDNRDGPEVFAKILEETQTYDAVFGFNDGDIVSGGRESEYVEFHGWIEDLSYPLYPVIGNHELGNNGREVFEKYYGKTYYSFIYDNTYFIILDDADDKVPNKIYGEQKEYLISELGKAQAYDNIIVIMHIPPFWLNVATPYTIDESRAIDNDFTDLMSQYNVDLVLLAHIHGFGEVNYKGVDYVITGGAGAPVDGAEDEGGFYHYLIVSVEGKDVSYEVFKVNHPDDEPELVTKNLQDAKDSVALAKSKMEELYSEIQSAKDRGADITGINQSYNELYNSNISQLDIYMQRAQEKFDIGHYRETNNILTSVMSLTNLTQVLADPLIEDAKNAKGASGNTMLYAAIALIAIIALAGLAMSKRKR